MTAMAEQLDRKRRDWPAEKSAVVVRRVSEIIELAEEDSLELLRSREVAQEVLDLIDDHPRRAELPAHYVTPRDVSL